MGGIGKTTLATALFAKISNQFDACCFIDDVSKKFRLHDGPLSVQKQILHQTLSEEHHQICNLHNASNLIRRRLCRQSVLLIFDNVDKVEQLEKIVVRREWLGAGSKIIIISRDEHILKEYGVDEVYKVPLLDWTNSLQLLCRKAFKLDHILNSYEGLVNGILHYANGLPLAIKVLGSFLFERDISEWESALARLRESPHNDVMDVLRLSFDGLNKIEKELFLHIACFFNWHNAKYVKNVLNCCGFHAHIGLRVLIDKSLVSIEEEIQMHDLLQELGRNIVQENSSKERRKWSRLWLKEQFCDVMLENMEKHVEAMVLDSEIRFDGEEMDVSILKHFSNLRLLIIEDVDISGSLSCLSNKLRYFEWHEYPFKYLPSNFQPNQLVQLILKHSCIKQLWKGRKYLPNLRTLDLSYSTHLIKVPNFGEFPNLEHFHLEGCKKLLWLDPSIGLLRKIVSLNLKDCKNLVSIPNNIFGLSSLKDLNMAGCSKVFNNPWDLNISESVLLFLPNSPFPTPTPTAQTNWLTSIISLSCLVKLDISFCGLNQLPDAIGCLHWLEELNLGGNKFVTLPSLRDLSKLVCLNLEHCKLLEYLPQLPFPTAIEPGLHMTNLRKKIIVKRRGLFIFNCPQLHEREHYFSSMAFSWLIQFILMNPQSFPDPYDIIQIVTPGSEIPSWFKNQNKGDSIRIDSSPIMHDNNNNIIGCVCCVVFSMAPDPPARYPSHIVLEFVDIHGQRNSTTSISVILIDSLITVKSNHIWLTYFPLESSWDVRNEAMCVATCYGGMFIEVKNLGYHWVYKQDFNLTKVNHRTLAGKRKYLAIEDEAQPQPQPQPKLHSTSKLQE